MTDVQKSIESQMLSRVEAEEDQAKRTLLIQEYELFMNAVMRSVEARKRG